MQENPLNQEHFILKVTGKHGLVFKARHNDKAYLKQVADQLLSLEDGHFTEYDIHDSDHANSEMTEPQELIHLTKEDIANMGGD